MLYASPPGGQRNRDALRLLGFGQLASPITERMARAEWDPIALDNGAWTAHQSGEPLDFVAFAGFVSRWARLARWVVAPDVVGDARATLALAEEWVPRLRSLCPVLVAAQDGMTDADVRAVGADGVAIGGSTEWKEAAIRDRSWRSLPILHVLRVNTMARVRACRLLGADSCDGTGATIFSLHAARMAAWNNESLQERLWL
jgi:hypothetical protein